MTELATAWMLGCTTGFFLGVTVAGCGALWLDVPKGSHSHRLDPGRIQRGNGHGGPTTPKPDWIPRGQHPRSITFPDPDPWRRPTNPYTGEPVQPNPPPSRP